MVACSFPQRCMAEDRNTNTRIIVSGILANNAETIPSNFASSEMDMPVKNKVIGSINRAACTCAKLKFRLKTRYGNMISNQGIKRVQNAETDEIATSTLKIAATQ